MVQGDNQSLYWQGKADPLFYSEGNPIWFPVLATDYLCLDTFLSFPPQSP